MKWRYVFLVPKFHHSTVSAWVGIVSHLTPQDLYPATKPRVARAISKCFSKIVLDHHETNGTFRCLSVLIKFVHSSCPFRLQVGSSRSTGSAKVVALESNWHPLVRRDRSVTLMKFPQSTRTRRGVSVPFPLLPVGLGPRLPYPFFILKNGNSWHSQVVWGSTTWGIVCFIVSFSMCSRWA